MSTHPRERLRALVVTTPANTAIAVPQSTVWNLGRGELARLEVVIPDGHVGLTGLAVVWGGRQLVPYEGGEWIVGNNDEVSLELDLYVDSRVTVLTYNLDDTFVHSHLLRGYVRDLEAALEFGTGLPSLTFGAELPLAAVPTDTTPVQDAWSSEADVTAQEFLDQLQALLSDFLDQLQSIIPATGAGLGGGLGGGVLPTTVSVPNVVGMDVTAAEGALDGLGLAWQETDTPSTQNPGTVIAQDPPAGSQVDPSAVTVQLQVAVAQTAPTGAAVVVPNVVGMPQGPAQTALRRAGLKASVVQVVDASKPKFTVIRQKPAAGRSIASGSTVTITTTRKV